ncbi:hypothetical protein CCANI_04395 [Corynebacterium canis]|nr:hypothetical protein CCANI_04395 [Corynebacterium canis]
MSLPSFYFFSELFDILERFDLLKEFFEAL